jgi:hypothetical protein
MTDAQSDLKVEIGHVLMMDVVEYSTLLITEQSRIMSESQADCAKHRSISGSPSRGQTRLRSDRGRNVAGVF